METERDGELGHECDVMERGRGKHLGLSGLQSIELSDSYTLLAA
jgi:hypothetical protein